MSMERPENLLAARGLTDDRDRLLSADEALAELHQLCGGTIPGTLAVPELLELVKQGREMGLRIAREFSAFDGDDVVTGFARIRPLGEEAGGGCELLVENWHRSPAPDDSNHETAERLDAIDRAAAEITARLNERQEVQLLNAAAEDGQELQAAVAAAPGKVWTEYVELLGLAHQQPLHWRLLDGVECKFPGSGRSWRVRLLPIGPASGTPRGFELLLLSDEPLVEEGAMSETESIDRHTRLIGSALTPVLRKPIARVIANAETIRAKLAGPLRTEYSDYAGNIASAGKHLSSMLDDLVDLEVVEAPGFTTAREKVDLGDVARRAGGILGVRAQNRGITLDLPGDEKIVLATAEFRRVLQILINLIGNAIAYSPEGSTVTVRAETDNDWAKVSVADQGPGVTREQAAKIFNKFERLGRDSDGGKDGGSGLGLYISHRLATAMNGDLSLQDPEPSNRGGAVFSLSLPAAA